MVRAGGKFGFKFWIEDSFGRGVEHESRGVGEPLLLFVAVIIGDAFDAFDALDAFDAFDAFVVATDADDADVDVEDVDSLTDDSDIDVAIATASSTFVTSTEQLDSCMTVAAAGSSSDVGNSFSILIGIYLMEN